MKRVLAFLISLSVFITCMSGLTASASDYDEQRRQYNSQSGIDCNYYGNKIVFIDSHKEKLILRNGLKGKARKSKKSISSATVSVAYYKDYVFYIDEHTGYLKRYSTKNHKIKIIAKGDINSFIIACGRVVYSEFDPYEAKNNGIYECKLSGKGKRRITKNESSQMYSYKGNLYYKEYDVAAVKRYNFKKKKSYKVLKNNSLKKMQVFAMEGKYLYLLKDKGNINSSGNHHDGQSNGHDHGRGRCLDNVKDRLKLYKLRILYSNEYAVGHNNQKKYSLILVDSDPCFLFSHGRFPRFSVPSAH